MAIHVEALIRCLGKNYKDIVSYNLLSSKYKLQGNKADELLHLDTGDEGLVLTFHNDADKKLSHVSLIIKKKGGKQVFPNKLPTPLTAAMSRQWLHKTLGNPDKSEAPKTINDRTVGWMECFPIKNGDHPLTMVVRYDQQEMAEAVMFLPTSERLW
ncbi:DUF6392 family protein [Enterobacteriaceae bacterium LUAb1]